MNSGSRLAGLLLALLPGCAPSGDERPPPTVILIVMDTTAARHLSLYGYQQPTTPHLERLAAGGVVYTDAFSTSPWTLPSHASLFTGLHPTEHGVTTDHPRLASSQRTLAELLAERGYRTLGFSNNSWVGPGTDLHRGFDQFTLLMANQLDRPEYTMQVTRRTEQRGDPQREYQHRRRRFPRDGMKDVGGRLTNQLIERTLDREDDPRPLFLFVNYMEPHHPYVPVAEQAARFLPEGVTLEQALAVPSDPAAVDRGELLLSKEQFARIAALYDAEIADLDARIGELHHLLEQRGLLENALFIVTSDHGEQVGEHGFLGHETNRHPNLYDDLLRVPLLVAGDPRSTPGARLEQPVQLIDLFATIVDRVDPVLARELALPAARPLPVASGSAEEDRAASDRLIISEYQRPIERLKKDRQKPGGLDLDSIDATVHAVRSGGWKLIRTSGGDRLLFHVETDRDEQTDLAGQEGAQADRLSGRLDRWLEAARARAARRPDEPLPEMDAETLEELRRLGYLR